MKTTLWGMRVDRQLKVPGELAIVLVGFLIAGLVYMVATPIFEASDELWHFGMVEVIRDTGQLPVQDPDGPETAWAQEGSQPPLYYAIVAALSLPFSLDDLDTLRYRNPHAKLGLPGIDDNKNLVVHEAVPTPPEGAALPVYLGRIFGIVLGMVTISAVYFSARLLAPGASVPLLAAGVTAFNPMFIFIAASVNNDNLVTALNSIVIYLMLRTLRDGFDTRRSLLMAVLIALATLSKLSGLVLVPVLAGGALWVAYRRNDVRGLVVLGSAMVMAWGLLAGWWYARNLELYGELFGTETMVAVAGPRDGAFTLQTLLDEFEGFRIAYWGLFGAVNILTTDEFYYVMDVLCVLAVLGCVVYLWRVRRNEDQFRLAGPTVLISVFIIGSMSLISWTAQTYASQGRLLFPFVAAISPLLALGWGEGLRWIGARGQWIARGGTAGLATFAVVVPVMSIFPIYDLPAPISSPPPDAHAVYADYGGMVLIGYGVPDVRFTPMADVPVTLYWQVDAATQRDYSVFVHLIDTTGNVIGKVDTFPVGGQVRTSTWESGIYESYYAIPVNDVGRFPLRMQVGVWNRRSGTYLTPQNADGQDIGAVVLDAGAFVGPMDADTDRYVAVSDAVFGEVISLRGYDLTGDRLSLLWEAIAPPPPDQRVFVQVLNAEGVLIGQGDAPPNLPTEYWQAGEQYLSEHVISFNEAATDGTHNLIVGWYDPDGFARLSTDALDDSYRLTDVTYPIDE